ncbi:DUF1501 domain-containing protein [Thalassomonas sp. M1454]|uniref:DUF1501 domain-containing protein n=1 Tax=Thalassomonas sp. M1454 TaxID=2594477 RepID=UPI00117DFD6E|nr:DUF1501 domain-containing protein [Thalassomonas sp. M1454]TRX53951.1 DUF1501 domain-containing protein [Thalassomonas sp. M1454]
MKRRQFVKMLGASASLVAMQSPVLAAINKSSKKPAKIVWLVLRGAMDSLHTVVPVTDPDYVALRPKLSKAFKDELLPLDANFALHPSLKHLHSLYKNKQMSPVVAVGSGYPKRSHFDGQDYLESGLSTMNHDTGWLGRAMNQLELQPNSKALAVANSVPISLRDTNKVSSWYPTNLKDADESIYDSLMNLYQDDELLLSRLNEGLNTQQMAGENTSKKRAKFIDLARSCGKLLASDNGTDCAMLEFGGWDTHNNQAFRLAKQLSDLDSGIAALQQELGEHWQNTVVMVATEFGRTVKENGTGGTDHGTGGAMFMLGGAVNGGKVLGNWPGLKAEQLFAGRDLMPTTSTFSWIATVLQQHWQLSNADISKVFPDAKAYKVKLTA